nr:schlafen family member 12 isoform X1 [Cavia porcellus]
MATGEIHLSIDAESDYAELVLDAKKVTLGEKARSNMNDHTLKKQQKNTILRATSALLKCAGGIIKMEIENEDYRYSECGIGHDLEERFEHMVPDVENYFNFMQKENNFFIFVKSGIHDQRYGTLSTNMYRRNLSRTDEMSEDSALMFLKELKKTEGRSYSTLTMPADRDFVDDRDSKDLAAKFFNSELLTYQGKIPFGESTHVECKSFLTKWSKQRIIEIVPKYVSAFANTDGGYLFIGLDEKTQTIIGLKKGMNNLPEIKRKIEEDIPKLPVYHCCKEKKKINYTCKSIEVHNKEGLYGYVLAIRIERFCCAVFAKEPDSWHVKDNRVVQMTSTEWVEFMMEGESG